MVILEGNYLKKDNHEKGTFWKMTTLKKESLEMMVPEWTNHKKDKYEHDKSEKGQFRKGAI